MRTLAIICVLLVTACTATPEVIVPELPECAAIELPRIPSDELQCLSDDAYTALVERDQMLQNEINRLCSIIRAHNEQ